MSVFQFKYFDVIQEKSALKVGTDAMLLGALIESIPEGRLLEIGSGTGVISLMLAQRTKSANIEALEIDELAANESKENFLKSPWSERLSAHHVDFFQWHPNEKYDLIFSNPPFYMKGMLPLNERRLQSKHVQFDFSDFLTKAVSILSQNGIIWLILPAIYLNEISEMAITSELFPVRLICVESKPGKTNRIIIGLSRHEKRCVKSHFLIRDNENRYSDEYIALTGDFHHRTL